MGTMMESSTASIRMLSPEIVDKIKAGEVIQKSSSAVKELIENSIDAIMAAKEKLGLDWLPEISILVSGDCIKVSDNGSGINRCDLSNAVLRHATSKLRYTEDLTTIATLGFRGEALASIVQASQSVTIVSRTREDHLAYTQTFSATHHDELKPCARQPGTTVSIQNLFHNLPLRSSLSNEYAGVLQVVQFYTLLHPTVAFVCSRKLAKGGTCVDINTGPICRRQTTKSSRLTDVICNLYGAKLSPHLVEFSDEIQEANGVQCSVNGYVTGLSYDHPKSQVLLFINKRWVDCPHRLKKRLREQWPNRLWACIFANVPPEHVDVNIHPTKKQVALLHEEQVFHLISKTMWTACKVDCVFETQGELDRHTRQSSTKTKEMVADDNADSMKRPSPQERSKTESTKRVRLDEAVTVGSLVPFLTSSQPQHDVDCPFSNSSSIDMTQPGAFATAASLCKCKKQQPQAALYLPQNSARKLVQVIPTSECSYKSIKKLRGRLTKRFVHDVYQKKFRQASFLGVLTPQRSLLQMEDELVMWDHKSSLEELFYQFALRQFGALSLAKLSCPIRVADVIARGALVSDSDATVETNRSMADQAAACLVEHSAMLKEYFSIEIEPKGGHAELTGLPVLLPKYTPQPTGLSLFLLRLATEINWEHEQSCFDGICKELSFYYAQVPDDLHKAQTLVRHTLFPASTCMWNSSKTSNFVALTTLNSLYRVFERC